MYLKLGTSTIQLNKPFTTYKGKTNLLSEKIKKNRRYFIYKDNKKIKQKGKKLQILEKLVLGDELIVVFIDNNQLVSFVKISSRYLNKNLASVLRKIILTPKYKMLTFLFMKRVWNIGVLSIDDIDTQPSITIGKNKNIEIKLHYLFSKNIRKKFIKRKGSFLYKLMGVCLGNVKVDKLYDQYIQDSDMNLPFFLKINLKDNTNYYYPLKYHPGDEYAGKHYIYNTRSISINKNNEVFIRKSVTGQYVAVITTKLSKIIILKEHVAHFINKLLNKPKNNLVFFEKFAEGASESAFELFKSFVETESNAYYILSDLPHTHKLFVELQKKYGKKIIKKNSYRYFKIIFGAKAFISSDLVSHIQRRLYDNDKYIKEAILNNKYKFFLQHGPSLATNVFARGYFNKKVPNTPNYISVNSDFEKDLFMEHTEFEDHELLKCGMGNMDLYVNSRNETKDSITFLLTWRPWDLLGEIKEDSYIGRYLTFLDIVKNDPFYKDKKVHLILHPKARTFIKEQMPETFEKIKKLIYLGDIKDAVIDSKILITDYSSLAYYGFAGGANVIFYWEDKVKCEKEYGAPNILQADNCFGAIAENMNELNELIKEEYSQKQDFMYKVKFHQLVETSEGDNIHNLKKTILSILEEDHE